MKQEIYKTSIANVDTYGKLSIRMGEEKVAKLLDLLGLRPEPDKVGGTMFCMDGSEEIELEVTVAVVKKES